MAFVSILFQFGSRVKIITFYYERNKPENPFQSYDGAKKAYKIKVILG